MREVGLAPTTLILEIEILLLNYSLSFIFFLIYYERTPREGVEPPTIG